MTEPTQTAVLRLATCREDFAGPGRRVELFREQGCHVIFDNGWTVSIQWGPYSYCANRALLDATTRNWETLALASAPDSPNAEAAAWKRDEPMIDLGDDNVAGWVPLADIRDALAAAERDDEKGIREALTRRSDDA